jgi:hypothetical protein
MGVRAALAMMMSVMGDLLALVAAVESTCSIMFKRLNIASEYKPSDQSDKRKCCNAK